MKAFREGADLLDGFRIIRADRDQFDVARFELATDLDKVRHLGEAGTTPGRPKVDDAEFVRGILPQAGDTGLVDLFDSHFLGEEFGVEFLDEVPLFGPLRGASMGTRDGLGNGFASEEGLDRLAGVVFFNRGRIAVAGVVETAGVAELPLAVEEEEVRRRHGTIGTGGGLGLAVVEVGKGELVARGVEFHLFERIAVERVTEFIEADGFGIVRRDGDELESLVAIGLDEGLHPRLGPLRAGAVVAEKEDREDFGIGIVGEPVLFAVDARKVEIGCRGPDLEGLHRSVRGAAGRDAEEGGEDHKEKGFHLRRLTGRGCCFHQARECLACGTSRRPGPR